MLKNGLLLYYREFILAKAVDIEHSYKTRTIYVILVTFCLLQEARPSKLGGQTKDGAVESVVGHSTRELKITLLGSEWNSSMGGLSTINTKLAVLLAKQPQVSVTFFVPQNACSDKERKSASQLKVTIREAKERPGFDDPLDWLCFAPRDLSIDIVVGHGAKLGKQAQFITESHGCKWVQMVHTAPEELGMYKDYPEAIDKGEMKNKTEVELCKLADLVVAVGAKLKEAYSSYLRSSTKNQHIIQLTPGTFDEFKTIKQASQDSGKFKVLTFGRGDLEDFKLKGYDIVPKALAELSDSSYRLVFVGTPKGKQEEVVKRLLQTGISEDQLLVRAFIQDREQLKHLFCEVDLAIMPSRTEGFGLSALEALSAGLPILVSGNSGFGHALRELPLGQSFVVESKDPKEWANAIASVRGKGREQRLKEIQCLRRSYEEKYSWENQCGSLVEKLWSMAYGEIFINY